MSKGAWIGILAVVVIIVLILALALSGLIPGLSLKSSSGGGGNSGTSYTVTFTETGLAAGTSWSATVGATPHSSTTSTIAFQETNNSYSWTAASPGYTASPASGSISVAGADVSVTVAFTALPAGTYSVTFSESGLPSSTSWSVTFNGDDMSSLTTTIVFSSTNGTSLTFTVHAVTGYTAAPLSGTLTVAGMAVSESITFTSSGGPPPGGQDSYSTAAPLAQTAAGSGWLPIFAYGIDFTASYTNTTDRGNATCPVTGGAGTWPTIPAYTGDYHSGELTGWIFLFYQSSTLTEEAIYVSGTSTTVLGEITGASCIGDATDLAGLGSGVIDSTTVSTTLAADTNFSAFISTNTTASAWYFLISGNMSDNAFWLVEYTSCTPGVTGPGYYVGGIVNASSGSVTFSYALATVCTEFPFGPHEGPASGGSGDVTLLLPGVSRAE